MRRRTVLLLFIVVMAALWLLVGCGREGSGGGGNGYNAPSGAKDSVLKTIRIEETEFRLEPVEITLDKPGTYVFEAVNSGDTVHALEVEGEGIEEKTPRPSERRRDPAVAVARKLQHDLLSTASRRATTSFFAFSVAEKDVRSTTSGSHPSQLAELLDGHLSECCSPTSSITACLLATACSLATF
jgi:hypothetical protein